LQLQSFVEFFQFNKLTLLQLSHSIHIYSLVNSKPKNNASLNESITIVLYAQINVVLIDLIERIMFCGQLQFFVAFLQFNKLTLLQLSHLIHTYSSANLCLLGHIANDNAFLKESIIIVLFFMRKLILFC
jgi:hypothetical protein